MMRTPYRTAPQPAARGFSWARWAERVCLSLTFGVLFGDMTGCAGLGGPGPNVIAPGLNFAICVLTNAANDVAKHLSPTEIAADLVSKCGGDLVTIATVLDADARAQESGGSPHAFREISTAARSSRDGGP